MKQIIPRLPAALLVLVLGLLAGTPAAHAISVIPPTFSSLVEKSDAIIRGTVIDRESRWVTNAAGHRVIKTYFTINVKETAKGTITDRVTLEFLGGTVGDHTMRVGGMPTFRKGERAWFFIRDNGRVLCPLAYAQHGAYLLQTDPVDGSERILRLNGTPLTSVDAIGADPAARPAANLSDALSSRAFGAAISREMLKLQSRQATDR